MAKNKKRSGKKRKAGENEQSVKVRKRGMLIYVPAFCSLIGTLMLLTVIALAIPLTVPQYLGYQIYDVVSGSMEPTIPVGSIIYVKETEPSTIKKGDIIAFQSGDSIVMHRVVDNKVVEGTYTTKGDANNTEDINEVPYSSLIGVVTRHIPIMGQLLILFGSTFGRICMICFAACGAILNILSARFQDAIEDEAIEESIRERELARIISQETTEAAGEENKAAENKAIENNTAENETEESLAAENRAVDNKAVENKTEEKNTHS